MNNENLDTYHPRFSNGPNVHNSTSTVSNKNETQIKRQAQRLLPRLTSTPSLRKKLTRRIARLSSLESTRSSSSLEPDNSTSDSPRYQAPESQNDSRASVAMNRPPLGPSSAQNKSIQRHQLSTTKYTSNRTNSETQDEIDDENDDQFQSLPHTSSSYGFIPRGDDRLYGREGQESAPNTYEDLLDDRQGMNNSEQQFTKGERANRSSVDGSIISEFRDGSGGKKNSLAGKGSSLSRKGDKVGKRSKSPSSSLRRGRQSRKGLFGLASRFKLTKKHDSIARFQLSILNSGFLSLKKLDRDLQSFLPRGRMTAIEFGDHVKSIRKYPVLAKIEYKFASRYETYVCRHACQESNQIKNNYKKCTPYDYNRVVLKTLPNVPNSDYINASHVDSYLKPNAYIAAQGPNENTIEDFWRMVWEQKSFVVVMLTKVFDFIKVMCNQYWPVEKNKPERYGNLEVTLLYEEPLADFVIRTIKLTKLRTNHNATEAGNVDAAEVPNDDKPSGRTRKQSGDSKECTDFDDTDYDEFSEEIIFNTEAEIPEINTRNPDVSVPRVRAPKYISVKGSSRRRSISADDLDDKLQPKPSVSRSLRPSNLVLGGQLRARSQSFRQCLVPSPQQNDFLHPSFGLSSSPYGGSSSSLVSMPNTPTTPVTPGTPNSAGLGGLDRSSATRKAVKKKRRTRVKDVRPMRTQFQVPDENQLIDDDEDQLGPNLDEWGRPMDTETNGTVNRQPSERIIYQFHYNSWASHTCPFISSLLHFRRRVRICMDEMSKSGKTGPTIVHCNDGCGRTGAYLCIDANLELAEEDNLYDVFNYTKKLRQSRKFLIENLEQYKFVYDTIEEAMFCGRTWFPVSELHQKLKHKSQRNTVSKKNEYQVEYDKICRMTSKFSIGDCAGGHRVENREKNRDVSTVPPDNFRPYLSSFQTNDSTDYINAVFVDGYTRSKEYIVTEWPLHKTISDFWSLIYDHDCNSVILLANPSESSTYPSFLPSEKELRRKFGPVFSAEMVSYTHYQNIKSWIYTINKKIVSLTEVIAGVKSEAKTTQVFQITCWPQGHRVPTSTNALVELMNMVERWRQRTAYGPVCVVSLNGKSRAGVYCAANVAIEQVVQHGEVDVFQAVKTVRRHRPQLIENMTEYKYCYDLILHYVLHYLNQSSANT